MSDDLARKIRDSGWSTEALLALALTVMQDEPRVFDEFLARLEGIYLGKTTQ